MHNVLNIIKFVTDCISNHIQLQQHWWTQTLLPKALMFDTGQLISAQGAEPKRSLVSCSSSYTMRREGRKMYFTSHSQSCQSLCNLWVGVRKCVCAHERVCMHICISTDKDIVQECGSLPPCQEDAWGGLPPTKKCMLYFVALGVSLFD